VSLAGAVALGVFGRAYAVRNGLDVADAEPIFIVLAHLLFNPLVTGFLYAALLAAVMSTVASQLLVSSSSLTEDFYKIFLNKEASERESVIVGRISVLLVGLVAAYIAKDPDAKVLGLVSHAWAGFGAAFGPMILLSLTWRRMSGTGAVAGLIAGDGTVRIWITMGWDHHFMGGEGIYEIIPGFIVSWIAVYVVSLMTQTDGEYRAAEAA